MGGSLDTQNRSITHEATEEVATKKVDTEEATTEAMATPKQPAPGHHTKMGTDSEVSMQVGSWQIS